MGEQANWQSRVISEDLAKPETAILLVSVEDTVYEGSIPSSPTKYAPVAQQEEHRTFNAGVPSSSLGGRTNLIQKLAHRESMLFLGCGVSRTEG